MVLQATEEAGFNPTGEFTQLNSYENRVFDIQLEKGDNHSRVVAKFYRPGRWSQEALSEEHSFLTELVQEGISAVAPLELRNKKTLLEFQDMWVAFFPKFMGKMPDELLEQDLYQVGRRLAALHNVGGKKRFRARPTLGEEPFSLWDHLDLLAPIVSPELWPRYENAAIQIAEWWDAHKTELRFLRIHGDCHRGNLLYTPKPGVQKDFFFVDFDDCMMGPAVQDFWMLFAEMDSPTEKEIILSGYEELRTFDPHEWSYLRALRGLRIVSYAAWIRRRWEDPSFQRIFPDYASYTYWAEETEALEAIAWGLNVNLTLS